MFKQFKNSGGKAVAVYPANTEPKINCAPFLTV